MLLAVFFTIVLDQTAKLIASSLLVQGESVALINGFLHLTLVHNTGTVFGFFPEANLYLAIISIVFLAVLSFVCLKIKSLPPAEKFSMGLIAGGAAGNLADRLRLGYVIDFIDFRIWPVFNFADIALTAGAALIIWKICMGRRKN